MRGYDQDSPLGYWPAPEADEPRKSEEARRVYDEGEPARTSCGHGCVVEEDGYCPHGHPSWLKRWGIV